MNAMPASTVPVVHMPIEDITSRKDDSASSACVLLRGLRSVAVVVRVARERCAGFVRFGAEGAFVHGEAIYEVQGGAYGCHMFRQYLLVNGWRGW